MFVEASFFFLPSSSFVFTVSLFIKLKYEIQGYPHMVPRPHFKATITNRSFRASPEISLEDDTKYPFVFNDYVTNEI